MNEEIDRCPKTRDEEHDWEGCICRRCYKTRDEEHDYVLVETFEKCTGWAEQGSAEFEWYETVSIYRCTRCSRKIESSSGTSQPQSVVDPRRWTG